MQNKSQKPNIIFLTLDALRPKNLGFYGYKRNTSPNIDSLAKKGVMFKNFFSSYNTSNKSFLSILGGRHVLCQDLEHYHSKNEMKSFFDSGGIFLQEILKNHRYKTYFLWKAFGWQKRGFDYYFKEDAQEKSKKWGLIRFVKKIPWLYKISKYAFHNFYFIPEKLEYKIKYSNDGEFITNKAIEIIKQNKKNKFFLWLHYTDTHVPHMFPYSFRDKFVSTKKSKKIFEKLNLRGYNKKNIEFLKGCWKINDTVEDIIAKYDTAIFYNDYLTGKIINTLKQENLLGNTIVFIFADHGESLNEHGLYFTHGGLYDVSFNIPLIIFGNGIPENKKIKALTQLEDLAPTVLDLVGITYDSFLFDGKSLLPVIFREKKEIRENILIEEFDTGLKRRGIRTKRYKYAESPEKEYSTCLVCNTSHGNVIELFDLENDPDENTNLAKKNKKLLIETKSKLDKTIREMNTLNERRRIKAFINKTK